MSVRKPRVKLLRDGRLHGRPVKAGDVVEVEPVVATRLVGRRAGEQVLNAPAPQPAEQDQAAPAPIKGGKKGKTE